MFGFGVNCIIVTLYRCLPDHICGGGSRLHVYVNEFIALNTEVSHPFISAI